MNKYLSFFLLMLLAWSCTSEEEVILKKDSDFFPLSVGSFFIYNVNETSYTAIDGKQDFVYQLKLLVADSFRNTASGITYVIQRSKKAENASTFDYLDTWSARIEASEVVVAEGNTSFVRLAFPLVVGKQWNGNALNNLGGEETCADNLLNTCDLYEVGSLGAPYELNGENLNQTLEVIQNNNVDLIVKQDVRKEIYARHIGLVYKESTLLEYCTVGSCIGQQQIEKGLVYTQTLANYGKE